MSQLSITADSLSEDAARQILTTIPDAGVTAASYTGDDGVAVDLLAAPPVDPYAALDDAVAELDAAKAPLSNVADGSVTLTADEASALSSAIAAVDEAVGDLDSSAVLPTAPSTPVADPTAPEPGSPGAAVMSDGVAVAL